MKQTKHKSENNNFIAFDDLVSRLGLLEIDVHSWLIRDQPKVKRDYRGRLLIPLEYLERYSTSIDYKNAFNRAVAAEKSLRESERSQTASSLKIERIKLLDTYDICITDLEALHRKYLDSANIAGIESSAMAAYLLFSRVISTLKMSCLCLRNGYWTSGSLLREIDECLDLALYFVITKNTSKGKQVLQKWFRQNYAPQHSDCRREIAIHMASIDKDVDVKQHQELLNELYQKKSKFTHPAYATVREVTSYNVDGDTSVVEIDYGPCGYERKLHELTHFFRSSLWSSFQIFIACFVQEFPLAKEDIEYLHKYDKKFQSWDLVSW